ncbi:hypothetical protein SASPL_116936 [Salvia splendens]|uniref:Uncharacterized protein n=1 Tax=Salvia splendens TaxID=180675 RepID=A0A8X8XWM3_SALSN|nr:hypothetical protein SASPL_116936 [Salvia splendens]
MVAVVVMLMTLLAFSALVEPSSAQAWKLPKPGRDHHGIAREYPLSAENVKPDSDRLLLVAMSWKSLYPNNHSTEGLVDIKKAYARKRKVSATGSSEKNNSRPPDTKQGPSAPQMLLTPLSLRRSKHLDGRVFDVGMLLVMLCNKYNEYLLIFMVGFNAKSSKSKKTRKRSATFLQQIFILKKGKVARMSKMVAVIVVTLLAFSALAEPSSAQAWKLPNPGNAPLPISGHPYHRGCSKATQCRGGTPGARKLLTVVKNGTN